MSQPDSDWKLGCYLRERWRRYAFFAFVLAIGVAMCICGGEGERLFELGAGIVSGTVVALAVFAVDAAADQRHHEMLHVNGAAVGPKERERSPEFGGPQRESQ